MIIINLDSSILGQWMSLTELIRLVLTISIIAKEN